MRWIEIITSCIALVLLTTGVAYAFDKDAWIENGVTVAVIGGLLKLLDTVVAKIGVQYKARFKAEQSREHTWTEGAVTDAATMRKHLMDQVQALWERVDASQNRIDRLEQELQACETRSAELDHRYNLLVLEVQRRLPDFPGSPPALGSSPSEE
ncbi:MAG TPA: hypothetical protein VLA89_14515 [Gemmatimonadales bacterium]|nr:hypothetical protein [Gemmatimonadales bacterium]